MMKKFPKKQPILETERLILRALHKDDATKLSKLANVKDVSRFLTSLPYPYSIEDAKEFIKRSKSGYKTGKQIEFAIIKKSSNKLIGMMGLSISAKNNHATIGYWIGKKYWSKGYASEAGLALLQFAFEDLKLYRICSHHFHSNPASGKVMQKIGLKYEGRRVGHYKKGKEYFDVLDYGLLRSELP